MNIIELNYKWKGTLSTRTKTDLIVLHHAAMNGDAYAIHNVHLQNGWAGIGYHFYIRKNGDIFRGRPIEKMGAHAQGHNNHSIGICFEGNFEKEKMTDAQVESGRELIEHIRNCYSAILPIAKHSDLNATACPGKNFRLDDITAISVDKTVNQMYLDGIISVENVKNWEMFLNGQKPKSEYVKTIIQRYQKALRCKE